MEHGFYIGRDTLDNNWNIPGQRYFNKNYFMAIFSVITLWGLMLLYIFLFKTNEYLESTNMFYYLTALFILLVIFFGRAYILRLKKGNL